MREENIMELELATIDDIIDELRRRKHHFLFVGAGPTNRTESEVIYAYQGDSYEELLWMIGGLRHQVMNSSGPNEPCDSEP